jgi:hypothetical protein
MMKNIFFLAGVVLIISQSCVKPIPVEIAQMEPRLAVNSQIIPNELIVVSVTRTFTSLYKQSESDSNATNPLAFDILVPHALVTITNNNTIDTLQQIADGIYASTNINLVNNGTYQLNVYDSSSKQQVSANTKMMKPAVVESITPVKVIAEKDTSIEITFEIADDATEKNYYFVSVLKTNKTSGNLGLPPAIQNIFNKSSYIYLYTDEKAKNGKITEKFSTTNAVGIKKSDTVLIMVANIEEKYYQYLTAFNKSNNILSQFTGEPINLPTNIVNGFGYFSAHFPYIDYIELAKY